MSCLEFNLTVRKNNTFLIFLYVLNFFLSVNVSASDLSEHMRSLSNGEVFDLSVEGPLGELVKAKGALTKKFIMDEIIRLEEAEFSYKNNTHNRSMVSYFYLETNNVTKLSYPHIENWQPFWNLNVDFLNSLKLLFDAYLKDYDDQYSLKVILDTAQKEINFRKSNNTFGEIYYGFEFASSFEGGRNHPFQMELSHDIETQIENQFLTTEISRMDRFNSTEESLVASGEMGLEEVFELRSLREATRILSTNTIFSTTRGGWDNNKYTPSSAPENVCFIAYCGEQAMTMLMFAERLERKGLLKNFSVQTILVRNHLFNNHAAVALKAKSSGKIFMLDNWLTDGQTAARIIPLKKWAWWFQGEESSISSSSLACRMALRSLSKSAIRYLKPPPNIRFQRGI